MHQNEIDIHTDQVLALVTDQLPHLAGLDIRRIDGGGTINAIFRVGQAVAVRFPLQHQDPERVRRHLGREASAADELRGVSPFPVPEPLYVGEPGHGYPLPWSAQSWLGGETATPTSVQNSDGFAEDLAALIAHLRACPTRGRVFGGDGRGGRLTDHDAWMEECINRSVGLVDTHAMRRMWEKFRVLPHEDCDVMSHTDLIPGNILTDGGRLAGVLDTGGFQAADPALDLVGAWHLLDSNRREALRCDLGCSDLQWQRGRAWAFEQAAGAFWYYRRSNPAMAAMGQTTLSRLMTDS